MLFWALLLCLGIILFTVAVVWVFPKMFLKNKYPIKQPMDRGIKKYKFSDTDYAVVYEPSLEARNFVTQYILAKKDGKKTIKCKIAPHVTYIDFDIILFDSEGKCFLVMNSMDVIGSNRMTEETELPQETAFASIVVNNVNNTPLENNVSVKTKKSGIVLFGISTLLLSILMSLCFVFSFSHIFGGLFKETFAEKMISSGWMFIIPTLASSVCITIACVLLTLKIGKGERNG